MSKLQERNRDESAVKGGSKYEPLFNFLRRSDRTEHIMPFQEIEAILGEALPASAYRSRAWWSNRSKGALQAASWMGAGYLVEGIDLQQRTITFRKPPATYRVERSGDTVLWTGELVRALRRHMGLSQTEFAYKIGVRQQTVSDWETNAYDPRLSMSKYLTLVAEHEGFKYGGEEPSE